MGIDIHEYAEIRTETGWVKVGPVFPIHARPDWARNPYEQVPNGANIWVYAVDAPEQANIAGDAGADPALTDHPFDGLRSYDLFGFFADVQNLAQSPVLAQPRGLPFDVSPEVLREWNQWVADYPGFAPSWLSLRELLEFDYDQVFENQRSGISVDLTDAGPIVKEEEKRLVSMREFLGPSRYFEILEVLESLGNPDDVRMVFWFDH